MLGNELEIDGLAVPAVKAEDAVCFLDCLPAFKIAEGAAGLVALLDVVAIKRRCERRLLLCGKSRGTARTSIMSVCMGAFMVMPPAC
jgi:hypothetical protein